MTTYNEIKAGYRVTVTSWENDADNGRTVSNEGLTHDEVVFLKALFDLVKKSYHSGAHGNIHCDYHSEEIPIFVRAAYDVVKNNYDIAPENIREAFDAVNSEADEYDEEGEDELYGLIDLCLNLLSKYGLTGDDYYTRVMETFKVEYIPVTIQIEVVTDKFVM